MDLLKYIVGPSVSLEEMLAEREWRAAEEMRQLETCAVLMVLSTNVAGPVKTFPLLRKGFEEARRLLETRLDQEGVSWSLRGVHCHDGGPTAFYAVETEATLAKRIACAVEETPGLGRLLDMDVLTAGGVKLERGQEGYPPRQCLLCGRPAFECGRSRRHSVEELQRETVRRLTEYFLSQYARQVEQAALRAMLYEVSVTPKPGLVDRRDSGAHRDMDFFTFVDSAAAIAPFFNRMCRLGYHSPRSNSAFCRELRTLGMDAEAAMYRATGGVNTHKGLIFSLGLLTAAAGQWFALTLEGTEEPLKAKALCGTEKILAQEFLPSLKRPSNTHGHAVCTKYQAEGIRAEAVSGFESVLREVLPCLRRECGTLEQRGMWALVRLMASVEDTNVLFRGGPSALQELACQASERLASPPEDLEASLADWNAALCRQGISPGGCADLLAVGYFLYFLETSEQKNS